MADKSITRVLSQKMQAKDITEDFHQAAAALDTGQLVKDEYFTLLESVNALGWQIGDPKMDSGLLQPGESLLEEYDVCKELLPEEVIWIMDQMLCHEVAWYMGHPLSQTLFTSVYVDRLLLPEPRSLEDAQFWRNQAAHSGGPLDEDFSSQLYNRPLLHKFDVDEILLLLDDAQMYLETSSLEAHLRSPLEHRLIFRQEFLSALQKDMSISDYKNTSSYTGVISMLEQISQTHEIGSAVPGSFSLKLQRTMASSVPPRPMVNIPFSDARFFLQRLCQDAVDLIQVINVKGNEKIYHAIHLFMFRKPQSSPYIRALLQLHLARNDKIFDRQSLRDFIFADLESLVLPDSILLDRENEKVETPSDFRFKIAVLMGDFVQRIGSAYWSSFRSACLNRARVRRTLCHFVAEWDNLQVGVEELDTSLQDLTGERPLEYSGSPQPSFSYPLSSWMYHWKLHQLRCILQMGFELSVYLPNELAGMLWYTCHICTTHLAHLNRMSFFVEEEGRARKAEANKRKQSAKNIAKISDKFDPVLWRLDRQFHHVRAHDNLAEALHALYTVLARHNLLRRPSKLYSTDKLRYELRMKAFLSLGIPQILPFEDFNRENLLDGESDTAIIDRAYRAAGEARRAWEEVLQDGWDNEWKETASVAQKSRSGNKSDSANEFNVQEAWTADIKNTIRACIATNIGVSIVKKRLEKALVDIKGNGGTKRDPLHDIKVEIPSPGEKGSYSALWPVPKIIET
ncbi:MAG: hypothetical protein Q9227_008101 [Pyrenula ochraceoflavens]